MFTIQTIINLIVTPELQDLLIAIIDMLPDYWWHVPASSSGKYHPAFSLGEGGLTRHSIVVAYFANRIATAWGLDQRTIDLVTIAALVHDGMKQGIDAGHTVHEHPVLMAKFIIENFGATDDVITIAHIIASHMGKWNTSKYSEVVLPVPADDLQKLLSAADMVAATKELAFVDGFFGD